MNTHGLPLGLLCPPHTPVNRTTREHAWEQQVEGTEGAWVSDTTWAVN